MFFQNGGVKQKGAVVCDRKDLWHHEAIELVFRVFSG